MTRKTAKRLVGTGVVVSLLGLAGYAAAGGKWLGTQIHKTTRAGTVKVVRTDTTGELANLKWPVARASLNCTVSAFRAKRLGHHNYGNQGTIKFENDITLEPAAGYAAKFHDACMSGDRAVNITMKAPGACAQVKVRVGVVGEDLKTRNIPVALDCHGYPNVKRYALTQYVHPTSGDHYSGTWGSDAKPGYIGVRVQGQTMVHSDGSKTRPLRLYYDAARKRYHTVAHPSSIQEVKAKGATEQRIIGNIYKDPISGGSPLLSYTKGDDVAIVGSSDGKVEIEALGYTMKRVEGYLLPVKG